MDELDPQQEKLIENLLSKAKFHKAPPFLGEKVMSQLAASQAPKPPFKWVPIAALTVAALMIGIWLGGYWNSKRPLTIEFVLNAPRAHSVSVVGDFTDWEPVPLTRTNLEWKVALNIPRGQFQYGFILNDQLLIIDPNSKNVVRDSLGDTWSLIDTRRSLFHRRII